MSIYIDDFLLASNIIAIINALKVSLKKQYDIKNFGEVKTIMG